MKTLLNLILCILNTFFTFTEGLTPDIAGPSVCHTKNVRQIILQSDQNILVDCFSTNTFPQKQWLLDSVLLTFPAKGLSVSSNNDLHLTSSAPSGLYLCLAFNRDTVTVVRAVNVTKIINHVAVTSLQNFGYPLTCGVSSKTLSRVRRIIDGTRSSDGSTPWMGMVTGDRNSLICGCTLLNHNWVVTAAHCLISVDNQTSHLRVKLGKQLRHQREPGQFVTEISNIVLHPNFKSRISINGKIVVNSNDIALLKLKDSVPSNSRSIAPICLTYPGLVQSLPRQSLAVVTGWGRVSVQKSITAYTLQEAKLPFVEKSVCVASSDYTLAEGTLCAGYAESYKPDTCDGDSGGPLSVVHNNTSYLVGIVSWGQGCSSPGKYGVYTDVEKYLDWIYSVVR